MYSKLIQEKKMPWGARVFATQFPVHGFVSFVGSVVGGTCAATSDEFAKIHAAMLLEGTKGRTKSDIQLFLDEVGASLSFAASHDRLIFSGRVREKHLDAVLALVADILTEPTFPAHELEILKKREQGTLTFEAQDTHMQANIALARMLFSPGHPNYVETTDESRVALEKITRKDMLAQHKKIIDRSSLILSIAGDIEPKNIFALADKRFKHLPQSGFILPSFAPSAPVDAQRVAVPIAHKSSIDYVAGIAAGITADHADYAPLLLGMRILGNSGGFTGRLMKTVREEEGLTYGVYAYLNGFSDLTDGFLSVWGTFAPELFEKGRAGIAREIKRIVADGVTAEETKKHREMYEARSRVQLANSGALANAAHNVIISGHPISYLDDFPKKVLKVSAQEVNKVLKKYLVQEKLSEASAGPV